MAYIIPNFMKFIKLKKTHTHKSLFSFQWKESMIQNNKNRREKITEQ